MQHIHGAVLLPTPIVLSEAMVVVRLLDVSTLDMPARVIGETRFAFSGGPVRRIPFMLAIAEASMDAVRATLSAEIRTKDPARLQSGDWVTTQAVVLAPQAIICGDPTDVAVERI